MTTTDLYAVLGVGRKARPATIKRAYHAKSKQHHPDMPDGSQEAFERIKLAYDVLSDKAKRARYDETGRYDDQPADQRQTLILQALVEALKAAVKMVTDQNAQTERRDMADIMWQVLQKQRDAGQEVQDQNQKYRDAVDGMTGRFKTKNGETNYLDNMLLIQLRDLDQIIEKVTGELDVFDAALDLLGQYTFEQLVTERLQYVTLGSGSTSASTGGFI